MLLSPANPQAACLVGQASTQWVQLLALYLPLTAALQTGHVRRFFYIDTQLSTSTAATQDGSSQAVVFPSTMSLLVQIQPNYRNKIYPPVLTIE